MANEPERPIETLLRAAVKQRRDEAGAPFELHPVNRRLLQTEVARTYAEPPHATGSFSLVLRQLWPRFAWGVALLAVLGVAARLLLPVTGDDQRQVLLAKNQPVSESVPAREPLPAIPTSAARVPLPSAPVSKTQPAVATYADTAQSVRAVPARPLGIDRPTIARDSSPARGKRAAGEDFTLAATPQLAEPQKPAEVHVAAPAGTPAPAPARIANRALEARPDLAARPAPAASLPATPAAPLAVAMAPAAASGMAAAESMRLTGDKSDLPAPRNKSLGPVVSANRVGQSPKATFSVSKSAADALKETTAFGVAQRFVQVVPEAKDKRKLAREAKSAYPVLASFQLEQAGRELRIVDGDGSVYSGYLLVADPVRRARSVNAQAPAAALASRASGGVLEEKAVPRLDSDRLAPPAYSFRVAGTNRSLNKQVVFTGNLLPATNAALLLPVTTNLSAASNLGGSRNAPTQPDLLPLLNTRISGKVVVGTGKAVNINALPANP